MQVNEVIPDGSSSGLFSGSGEEEERVGDYSEVAECVDDMSGERAERVDLRVSLATQVHNA